MKATIDECCAELHRLGFSYGDSSAVGPDGKSWSVYAHKDQRKILTHAPTQIEAYRSAVREALEG